MENDTFYSNYNEAKQRLIIRLIGLADTEYLRRVPFSRAFADLAAVPCLFRENERGRAMGHPVSLLQMAQWGMEPQRLLQDAVENMWKILPPRLFSMERLMESSLRGSEKDVIRRMLKKQYTQTQEEVLDELACVLTRKIGQKRREESGLKPMWVLGNERWLFGAASLLYPGILQEISRKLKSGFYILPSSVHEVILLPQGGTETKERLQELVNSANQKMKDKSGFLSEHVYYYDRNNMEIQTL